MSDLAQEITEYLTGERRPMSSSELIGWIVIDAQCTKQWTEATHQQWELAIKDAVQRGLLVERDGKLWLAPPEQPESKPEQLELFG